MTSNYRLILLLLLVSTIYGKYYYEKNIKTWEDAQNHCRTEYTDLAPISNNYDRNLLFKRNPEAKEEFEIWIGLTRNPNNNEQWLWSGGDAVQENKTFWDSGQPNNVLGWEDRGVIRGSSMTWHDVSKLLSFPFFCYKVHVVSSERKTWEEALEYCREHHRDLASVASKTELMLMQKELSRSSITENVWIGLTFLAGDWFWVDKQPLEYEAWGPDLKPSCPNIDWACGAIRVKGPEQNTLGNVEEVVPWDALNCNQKKYFLCY